MELTIRPSSSTPKEFKFRDTNRYLHTHVQRTVHNSQRVRTTQVSINWRADKQKRGPATQQNIIRPQGGMKLPVLKQAGHRNVTPRMLITFSHTALHPSKLPQKQVLKVLVKSLSSHVTKLTMVIILHYKHISNHHVAHFKLIRCYLWITSQNWKKELGTQELIKIKNCNTIRWQMLTRLMGVILEYMKSLCSGEG